MAALLNSRSRPGRALPGGPRHLLSAMALCILVCTSAPSESATVVAERYGGFLSPTRVALTGKGDVYVSDHRRGIIVILDSFGKRIGTIGGVGAPLGVAVFEPTPTPIPAPEPSEPRKKPKKKDPPPPEPAPSVVYVGDEADGSVRLYVDGEQTGTLGQGAGEFQQPNSIETIVDAAGNLRVYVVDSKANQVKVYDDQQALLFTFGAAGSGPGEFKFPSDIAVDPALGLVYVSDFGNARIVVFDLDGAALTPIPTPPNDQGDPVFFRPAGLGIDRGGNLYVVDNGLSCVAILDPQGALIDVIGYQDGQYWTNELVLPVDAAANRGRVYVTSNRQHELVVFEVVP